MKIAPSARSAIADALRGAAPGSVPYLLLGYTYDYRRRQIPTVEIGVHPPDALNFLLDGADELQRQPLQDHDGITFYMVLSDDDGVLDGRLLTCTDSGFCLKLQ